MRVYSNLLISIVLLGFTFLLGPTILRESANGVALYGPYDCNAYSCYNTSNQKFRYNSASCRVVCDDLGVCQKLESSSYPGSESITHMNTNFQGSGPFHSLCTTNPPTGCQQGYYGSSMPSCSGQEGGGGGDCPEGCHPLDDACSASGSGGACPGPYQGRDCHEIPCGYRDECGCSGCLDGCSPQCDQQCGGGEGGGGSPTATPTPAPSCDLTCPGIPIDSLTGGSVSGANDALGGYAGANVRGATTLLAQSATGSNWADGDFHACGSIDQIKGNMNSVTYGYGIIEDNLVYEGYNGFTCAGLYACPLDPSNPEECPEPTIISNGGGTGATGGGGGNSVKGAFTQRVLGATSDSMISNNPVGKVLGAITSRLLAQAGNPGGSPGGGSGAADAGGYFQSTWEKAVKINRLNGSEPTLYGYTVQNATGQSCSCQAILGCQESQMASPNSDEMATGDCDEACNFTLSDATDLPTTTTGVEIEASANEGFENNVTIDFDDGTTQPLPEPFPQSLNHVFSNAGVYDVKLTCNNNGHNTKTCTRRVNVYCEGTDPESMPTPTPTPPDAWFKLKDSTLHTKSSLNNPAPTNAVAYDETDVGSCSASESDRSCVSSGKAGAVIVEGSADYGARLSSPAWLLRDSSYTRNVTLNPNTFIEYVRARKEVETLNTVTSESIQVNTINYFEGDAVIEDNDIPDAMAVGEVLVLIINGDLTININHGNEQTFNPDNKAIALIVTGEIEIASATEELNGIFVSNTADFAYDSLPETDVPLKINGNFTTMGNTPVCTTKRQRDDNELQPSCFLTFDFANQYLPMIDLLSTRTYEWTELVP